MMPLTPNFYLNSILVPMMSNWFVVPFLLWVMPWKAIALWKAAKNNHKWWFVALFLINTLGILEILYIFIFSNKNSNKQIK